MIAITRFERARLISARALQLAFGAPPLIKAETGMSAYELASSELAQHVLPLAVIRRYPDGRFDKVTF